MVSKTHVMVIIIIALSLITAVSNGCSKPAKIEQVNITLQQNLVIGDSDENLYQNFVFIRAVDVDKEGNIYLLDQRKVLKFDKFGKFLWCHDQKGEGPGELRRLVDLVLSGSDKVIIADQNSRKIMIFSTDGKFIDEFKIKDGLPIQVDVDSKGFIYCCFLEGTSNYLLHKYSQDGKLLKSFLEKRFEEEKNPFLTEAKNSIQFCISGDDHIYVTYKYEYKIMKYDTDGNLIKEWIGKLPYTPKKMRMIEPQPGWLTLDADQVCQDMAVDSLNNIYILWGTRPTENGFAIDIFNPEGNQTGQFYSGVKPDLDVLIQFFYIDVDDNLYIMKTGEDPRVVRFKMIREPGVKN